MNQGFFLVGLHYTTATNAAVINTLIPVLTLLMVVAMGKERLTAGRAGGFFLALVGVLVLRKAETFTLSDRGARGDLFLLANTTAYAAFLAFSKDFVERHDRLWTTAWFFIFGAVGLSCVAAPELTRFHPPPLTLAIAGDIAVVILAGTVFSYYLINWALARADSSRVALFVYVQPVVATGVACVFFGEALTARTVLSAAFLFMGVYFATRPIPDPGATPQPA
jgi:drug/metabolite transporter (DMT)-like permease